jgi:hypothetical protein
LIKPHHLSIGSEKEGLFATYLILDRHRRLAIRLQAKVYVLSVSVEQLAKKMHTPLDDRFPAVF